MRKTIAVALLSLALFANGATYYVSPDGTGTSTTTNTPGALAATIAAHSASDSIVLLQGLYALGTSHVLLDKNNVNFYGYPGALCVLSNYPVSYDTVYLSGSFITVSNLVITSAIGGTNYGGASQAAFINNGTSNTIVDVALTHCGMGFPFTGSAGLGSRVVGAIVLNTGVSMRDHGAYLQNSDGTKPKRFEHCFFMKPAGYNVQAYSSTVNGIHLFHNVLAQVEPTESGGDILIRGDNADDNIIIRSNCFWSDQYFVGNQGLSLKADKTSKNCGSLNFSDNYGFNVGAWEGFSYTNLIVTNNWLVNNYQSFHAKALTNDNGMTNWVVDYNTYGPTRINDNSCYGLYVAGGSDIMYTSLAAWKAGTGLDTHSTETDTLPAAPVTFVWKHPMRDKTGMVTVYNYTSSDNVTVDVSSLGMSPGDPYCLIFAQNPLGGLVRSNAAYGGTTISIPMTNLVEDLWTTNNALVHTATMPNFGVFLVTPPDYFLAHAYSAGGGGDGGDDGGDDGGGVSTNATAVINGSTQIRGSAIFR